jgi:SAM-dependent methyltransferase
MNKKQWYETLFKNYGKKYDNENFTKGTIGECDFLEKEFGFDKTLKILDVGCGTGRHSIELAKRRYSLTGIDLSESQLAKAREKALANNLKIDFLRYDARDLPFENEFDAAIMLCEGAFPLMETDEMNFEILKNVSKSLKKKAKFIFTTLNRLFPLFHSIDDFHSDSTQEGNATYKSTNFDLMTFRDHNVTTFEDDDGNTKQLECNERYYVPSEITWLLKSLGFTKIEIFGAKLGAFSRGDKLLMPAEIKSYFGGMYLRHMQGATTQAYPLRYGQGEAMKQMSKDMPPFRAGRFWAATVSLVAYIPQRVCFAPHSLSRLKIGSAKADIISAGISN